MPLIPLVAFAFSGGRRRFRHLPLLQILLHSCNRHRPPGAFHQVAQSAMIRSFFPFRLRHRYVLAAFVSSSLTAGFRITTLAHSSNIPVLATDCVHLIFQNHGRLRHHSALQLVCPSRATFLSHHESRPLTAWLPGRFCSRGGTTLPEEAGDICLQVQPRFLK